ncbi:MAG: hypothetical protein V4560_14805 [Bacteroidota bacterium]
MPYIFVPQLNPVNVVDKNRTLANNYNWNHFDKWLSIEQITQYEQHKCDEQRWQFDDICWLQIQGDFSPVRVQVRNQRGLVILSQVMDIVATISGRSYFESQIAFDDPVFVDGGYFFVEFIAGDPILITLEATVWHVQERWPNTLLVNYSHNSNNEILWETGISMNFRVDAVIPYDMPASTRTVYTDQPQSAVTVKGAAYRKFNLIIGTEGGVPDWVIDKMEDILNQNNQDYDGKPFSAASGATWNTKKIERYPWAQWTIEMREEVNRRGRLFEVDGLQEKKVAMDYVVEGALFGPVSGPANDNSYTINHLG